MEENKPKGKVDAEPVPLATEIIHDLKIHSQRLTKVIILLFVIWVLTIAGFLWYFSLPTESIGISQTQTEAENSNNTIIGGDYGISADGEVR